MTYAAPTATLPDHPQVSCTPCKAAQAGRLRWCHGNKDSYDAWGKRRNTSGHDSTCGALTSATTRGYTDQEMIDPLCDVNLNARIYDSTLGRMMSPDPTVPNPFNGQSYNRYSYVNNGPTYAIDPSGYAGHGIDGPCDVGSDIRCINYDSSADTNAGALLSAGGSLGNALVNLALGPGFCNNSDCNPGVSTEFTAGTSIGDSNSVGNSEAPLSSPDSGGQYVEYIPPGVVGDPQTGIWYNSDGTVFSPSTVCEGDCGFQLAQWEEANPPGTDWEFQKALGEGEVHGPMTPAQIMTAYGRQNVVNNVYLSMSKFLVPVPQTSLVPPGTGVETFSYYGNLTFLDRNGDNAMDEAVWAPATGGSVRVNYGNNPDWSLSNFNAGWQPYNYNNTLPPPPNEPPEGF